MKSIVVANWKMNPGSWRDAKKLFEATRKAAEKARGLSIIVAPPAIFLRDLKTLYKGKKISFAAQNARAEEGGAFTGDMSLMQCKDAGAQYVIIGHAERRALGETDEEIGKKVAAALALKMTPILCVGERERTGGAEYFDVVRNQLRIAFSTIEPSQILKVIVAYEPVWAIGKTEAMHPREMHEMAIFIRKTVVDHKGAKGMELKILYGGSIDSTNAPEMLRSGDVHGFLVGRASEDGARMTGLLQAIEQAR